MGHQVGICPECGSEALEYEGAKMTGGVEAIKDDGIRYPYYCEDCNFKGVEWYDLVFTHHLPQK